MTKFFVTCGTSLSEASRCWKSDIEVTQGLQRCPTFDSKRKIRDLFAEGVAATRDSGDEEQDEDVNLGGLDFVNHVFCRGLEVKQKLQNYPSDTPESLSSYHDEALEIARQHFDVKCWRKRLRHLLPAELATIISLQLHPVLGAKDKTSGIVNDKSSFYFIGSRSNLSETALCAASLKVLAEKNMFPTPRTIECLVDLDINPVRTEQFRGQMAKLWQIILKHFNDDEEAVFLTTGSYKVVTMELARRIGLGKHVARMFYLFEEPQTSDENGLIEINLRGSDPGMMSV